MQQRYSSWVTWLSALAASAWLAGCGSSVDYSARYGGTPPTGTTAAPTAIIHAQNADAPVSPAIVAADNAFGLSVLDALLPGDGGNVAISPLSVALALQVLYNGAAGSTQEAMAQTLTLGGLSDDALNSDNAALQAALINPDPKVELTIANSLWINQGDTPVLPSFTQTDQTYYGATVGDLAGAPADVNAWVDGATHGLIPQILPPNAPPGSFRGAIIANALYFKGAWTNSFDPTQTAAAPFTLSDGTQTAAQLMHQTGSFAYLEGTHQGTGFQALRLPYGGGRMSMLVVLPEAGADLSSFVAGISADELNGWSARLQPTTIAIALPRFTSRFGESLKPALTSIGMGVAFSNGADFSQLAPGALVSDVIHDTVVEVDETGTVAAAATVATITTIAGPQMTMDHPFFYAIRDDKTGELLFIGVLMSPAESGSN
jgi:serine protease inhibitor